MALLIWWVLAAVAAINIDEYEVSTSLICSSWKHSVYKFPVCVDIWS